MNSLLLNLIRTDPGWREECRRLKIKIKEEGRLAIFNYDRDADFSNPLVREARGIIIDTSNKIVISRAFDKFFNIQETLANTIKWRDCQVLDKIDGSIVKLYAKPVEQFRMNSDKPDEYHVWNWATNSCINAWEAPVSGTGRTFHDVIMSAVNYRDIDFQKLDMDYTYIFELVSPETQVLIKYPFTMLYHLATRNNKTGEEIKTNIGVIQPKAYDIHTEEDCLEAAKHLNDDGEVKKEGFVVVDSDWHRVKIKSPEYLQLHHIWNNGVVSKDKILKMIVEDDIPELDGELPDLEIRIKYYQYELEKLKYNISRYIAYARGLYAEYDNDRAAVAKVIKKQKFAPFGFSALGNNKTAEDLLAETKLSTLNKIVPDYKEEDLYS